jgi:hypothetical protein
MPNSFETVSARLPYSSVREELPVERNFIPTLSITEEGGSMPVRFRFR